LSRIIISFLEQLLGPIFKDLKDEARQAQKKRTSETFDLLEALLLIYLRQYKKSNYYSW